MIISVQIIKNNFDIHSFSIQNRCINRGFTYKVIVYMVNNIHLPYLKKHGRLFIHGICCAIRDYHLPDLTNQSCRRKHGNFYII